MHRLPRPHTRDGITYPTGFRCIATSPWEQTVQICIDLLGPHLAESILLHGAETEWRPRASVFPGRPISPRGGRAPSHSRLRASDPNRISMSRVWRHSGPLAEPDLMEPGPQRRGPGTQTHPPMQPREPSVVTSQRGFGSQTTGSFGPQGRSLVPETQHRINTWRLATNQTASTHGGGGGLVWSGHKNFCPAGSAGRTAGKSQQPRLNQIGPHRTTSKPYRTPPRANSRCDGEGAGRARPKENRRTGTIRIGPLGLSEALVQRRRGGHLNAWGRPLLTSTRFG